MPNDPNPSNSPQPQHIPLVKLHALPGIFVPQSSMQSYGGLVSSIQATGVKEPVILRHREDGEYQIVHGYRRCKASELAKKQDIPALVYDMTVDEAIRYRDQQKKAPNIPIPGKLVEVRDKPEEEAPKKEPPKKEEKPADAPAAPDVDKDGKDKPKEEPPKKDEAPQKDEAPKKEEKPPAAKAGEKKAAPAAAPVGPAATGPTGTAITQVFDPRLDPPDEKAKKAIPLPKEGESFFITLHPGYLEKSKFNTFSVDLESENFKELRKAIELAGVKDPVLARPKEGGGLEILSGQRRHLIATEFNYPVPVIIQRMDDDDAKILVADSNLHRDKITSYDLSRALRMKMDGMKRKAGRRRKDDPTAPALNSDEMLAKEMGMSTSKLNRIIRLSEATKDVCTRYDEGDIELSIASALSFLKPKNQDMVVSLMDLGYKITTKRVERMKPLDTKGKLTEKAVRDILEDKDIMPPTPAVTVTPSTPPAPTAPTGPATVPTATVPGGGLPLSPDIPTAPASVPAPGQSVPPAEQPRPSGGAKEEPEDDITKGKQERPEVTKIVLTGDRLRYYFPDVMMTPREIEESIYAALEERRQRQERQKAMKKAGLSR